MSLSLLGDKPQPELGIECDRFKVERKQTKLYEICNSLEQLCPLYMILKKFWIIVLLLELFWYIDVVNALAHAA
jgi:hypothetical protein